MAETVNIAPKRVSKLEACQRLRMSPQAVGRLIESGDLKTIPRLANVRRYILESSVDQLVARMYGDDRQAG